MAASDKMWVVLKIYAADGENGLHPHPNEDHTFVVLQGEAKFYGPNHETLRSARTKAYCYHTVRFIGSKRRATSDERRATNHEPLVMVRIGAAAFDGVYGERKSISVDVHTHGGKTWITSKAPLNGVLFGG
jgi:hypothetical protein